MENDEVCEYEEERELVNDETDWGYTFDDMDQDNWEDHLGGPEDDYFEQA
ncbi:MAG: hypothetical protein HQL46_16300 [Gammaproteobacteria bacterium]|nr:hypothetical protein [Gammaproteobacteria bacterium]